MTTQALLEKIAAQGLAKTTKDEMIRLACAFWHEDFFPELDRILQLSSDQQQLAGYLTEFYSMYHCVEESRALALVNLAKQIKTKLAPVSNPDNPDDIAAEWGLRENLNPFLADLLYYQTRHYVHPNKKDGTPR